MIGDHGAAGFADDRRVIDAGLVADFLDVVDDVVGVFLEAVVDRGLEVGFGAVVIDAQAAADVDVLKPGARLLEFGVDADQLDDRRLHVVDVVDLAAQVEMEQVEAVAHFVLAEEFEGVDDFGDKQAKLGADAAGLLPTPRPARGELDADTDRRLYVVQLGVFGDQFQLAELFDHRDDVAADLGGQDHRLDELIVLEPVADDRGVVVLHQGHDSQEFGLGAGLQAEAVGLAEVEDLLDHVPLLVDLDGVDAAVVALGTVTRRWRWQRRCASRRHGRLQNVRETDEQGKGDVASRKLR